MALTLPYPNLDFVPLDVLTAEEMNEIVANYTYIANQFPIASANIATAGVTSSNIDWTTVSTTTMTPEPTFVDSATKSYYMEFGRLVLGFVNCYFKAGTTVNTNIFTGLPQPVGRVSFILADSANKTYRCRILENTTAIQVENGFGSGVYVSGIFAYFKNS